MSEKTMSVTEAARNFSRIIRRAERRASTLLVKNGKPVARVVPVETSPKTTRSLAEAWPRMRHLNPKEADTFAADIEAARKTLPPLVSPWDKS
jgi:prevent-host-death family protein